MPYLHESLTLPGQVSTRHSLLRERPSGLLVASQELDVVFGVTTISDPDYATSLHQSSFVIPTLEEIIKFSGEITPERAVLQCQETGPEALRRSTSEFMSKIMRHFGGRVMLMVNISSDPELTEKHAAECRAFLEALQESMGVQFDPKTSTALRDQQTTPTHRNDGTGFYL
ncbi:hypothetical protein L336_0793 [Candidatus Saccharimonas aalborgensis]|jgi:hypothetical protein|uniref:Uncharacterized protein n=1 Tax=Candidatus Saccharimonas aalborgensis TaxID=1332188 RepID=R4PW56_9BACT|nr:hypothetical protein [Candidatus Saccharimonas aalborgensis]AGL62495.1 hypothetical protein L336_0793 [Candidatus Saccharimonas aalborgensis]QQS67996.1 MAG: hypothetical protein IPP24_03175 [Candidatus Saccharibacteria bacterium]QQS70337.1 MAG: hypothetical protein IPP92_03305 [Candidatus Saccharibacteria bacterium]